MGWLLCRSYCTSLITYIDAVYLLASLNSIIERLQIHADVELNTGNVHEVHVTA